MRERMALALAVMVVAASGAAAQPNSGADAEAGIAIHKVQAGDTLELLAAEFYGDRRHKIYIMIENRLDHGRELKPGEKLRIPVSSEVTAGVGDTLASLTAQHLGDERRLKYLAEFNGVEVNGTLPAGMSLTIPLRVSYRAAARESLSAIAAGLFADSKKAELLRDYNFLQKDSLNKGESITVPIYLRVHPSKRRPPDAASASLLAKRADSMEQARRSLPTARTAWRAGDYAAVKRELAALVGRFPFLDTELVVEVGILLGAAYIAFDDVVTARATFRLVLDRDPKYALSAYYHSPKVRELWRKAGGQVDESTTP